MKIFFLLCLVIVCSTTKGQDLTGLWGVTSVRVGEELMTPVAKWFRLNPDKTATSGNGWTQNMVGAWRFDSVSEELSFTNTYGIKDEFEPFKVMVSGNQMEWTREEDGMQVVVYAERIEEMPAAPADLFSGLWIPDESPEDLLFIRSDRLYRKQNSAGRSTGYWHINGHHPEVTFLPHTEGESPHSWRIEVDATTLKMIGISDENKDEVRTFTRTHSF